MLFPMKSLKTRVLTLVLSLAAIQASATCIMPGGNTVKNSYAANFQGLTGIQDTDITGAFWAIDAAIPGFGTTNNNGTRTSNLWLFPYKGTHYVRYTWADGGIKGCIGMGIGLNATRDNVVLINNRTNEGQATHAGTFIAVRYGFNWFKGGYEADPIVNGVAGSGCPAATPNCFISPVLIPLPGVCISDCAGVTYDAETGAGIVQVSFAQPDITGYYNDRAVTLATPLVAGYEIYQINAAAAPVTSSAGAWGAPIGTLANTDCADRSCAKLLELGTPVPQGQSAYLAVRVVFDSGFKSAFVSGNSAAIEGPSKGRDRTFPKKHDAAQAGSGALSNFVFVSPATSEGMATQVENAVKSDTVSGNPAPDEISAFQDDRVSQGDSVSGKPAMSKSRAIPADVPVSLSASLVTLAGNRPGLELRWTTTDESRINGFDILVSKYSDSGFVLVNPSQILADGVPTRYSQKVSQRAVVAQAGSQSVYHLMLQVVMRDGSLREVGPVAVSFPPAAKNN